MKTHRDFMDQLFDDLSEFAEEKDISIIAAIEIHKLAIPELEKAEEREEEKIPEKMKRMRAQLKQLEQQLVEDGVDISKI